MSVHFVIIFFGCLHERVDCPQKRRNCVSSGCPFKKDNGRGNESEVRSEGRHEEEREADFSSCLQNRKQTGNTAVIEADLRLCVPMFACG